MSVRVWERKKKDTGNVRVRMKYFQQPHVTLNQASIKEKMEGSDTHLYTGVRGCGVRENIFTPPPPPPPPPRSLFPHTLYLPHTLPLPPSQKRTVSRRVYEARIKKRWKKKVILKNVLAHTFIQTNIHTHTHTHTHARLFGLPAVWCAVLCWPCGCIMNVRGCNSKGHTSRPKRSKPLQIVENTILS